MSNDDTTKARWLRLPKVRRAQALYDLRFRLGMLRDAAKGAGHQRDRAQVALLEMLCAAAGIETEQDAERAAKGGV